MKVTPKVTVVRMGTSETKCSFRVFPFPKRNNLSRNITWTSLHFLNKDPTKEPWAFISEHPRRRLDDTLYGRLWQTSTHKVQENKQIAGWTLYEVCHSIYATRTRKENLYINTLKDETVYYNSDSFLDPKLKGRDPILLVKYELQQRICKVDLSLIIRSSGEMGRTRIPRNVDHRWVLFDDNDIDSGDLYVLNEWNRQRVYRIGRRTL